MVYPPHCRGRIHAAPTNRPGTAGKWQNRCLPQTSTAGVNARPTGRRKRPYSPQPPRGRKPPPDDLLRLGRQHAAREHCGTAHCRAGMVFTPHCRAGPWPRRTDDFFKFYNVRRAKSPALQSEGNGQPTVTPARGAPLPGGMYASPTNTRYRVYNTGDGWRRKVYGPHTCGPYEPPGNGR